MFNIITLDNQDKPAILAHLTRLNKKDRHLRFFCVVNDCVLERYVNISMDLNKERAFGIFGEDKKTLIAFVHITAEEKTDFGVRAELGISVDEQYRNMGLAKQLMARALIYCKGAEIKVLYVSFLRENEAMKHLALEAGLKLILDHDEAIAELKLAGFPLEKLMYASHDHLLNNISVLDKMYRRNAVLLGELLKGN